MACQQMGERLRIRVGDLQKLCVLIRRRFGFGFVQCAFVSEGGGEFVQRARLRLGQVARMARKRLLHCSHKLSACPIPARHRPLVAAQLTALALLSTRGSGESWLICSAFW